jgi:ABC-type transporter Mla MlaB component
MQTMANMTWSALFRRGQGNAHSSRQQELEAKSIRRALRIKAQMKVIKDGELNELRTLMRRKQQLANSGGARNGPVAGTSLPGNSSPNTTRPGAVTPGVLAGKINAIEAAVSHEWRRARVQIPAVAATAEDSGPVEAEIAEAGDAPAYFSASTRFSVSMMFPDGPADAACATIMDDAAAALACGPVDAAAQILQEAIAPRSGAGMDRQLWQSLLDLFRVTGRAGDFDSCMLDYCDRFNEEAPFNFHPEATSFASGAAPVPPAASAAAGWAAPAVLAAAHVQDLALVIGNAEPGQPVRIDWRCILEVSACAARPLAYLMDQAARLPIRFVHVVPAHLMRSISLLGDDDPAAEKSAWLLRFALLGWLGKAAAYDAFAMRFCLRFEMSPPDWRTPACTSEIVREPPADVDGDVPVRPSFVLVGEITGDDHPQLARLARRLRSQDLQLVLVDCSALVRMDFAACVQLLNCIATRPSSAGKVRFESVHRLMARLLVNVGCGELAAIRLRA